MNTGLKSVKRRVDNAYILSFYAPSAKRIVIRKTIIAFLPKEKKAEQIQTILI